MVSVMPTVVLVASALASASSALEVGEYYRPTGDEVSGFVNATTAYVRSPCPALNTLANHGYLPRDGKSISQKELLSALQTVFNLDDKLAGALAGQMKEGMSLSDLSKHNLIEHDASLAHPSWTSSEDPSHLDEELWEDLIGRAVDGQLTVKEFGQVRKDRKQRCDEQAAGCDLDLKHTGLAYGEAAAAIRVMGGKNDDSVSVEYLTSFFVEERLPADFKMPEDPVTVADALITVVKLGFYRLWPFSISDF